MRAAPFRHLFVVTYGRSGSTLLMGWLNRLPGVCVRGENNGALLDLWRSVRKLQAVSGLTGKLPPDNPTHPWYGAQETDVGRYAARLADAFVAEVLKPPSGCTTVGFKEIRHDEQSVPDLDDYLDFLFETFPEAGVLFNVRDPATTARSKWWSKSWGARREISRMRARFETSRFASDPRCATCAYEKFIAGPDEAARIAGFLGHAFDEDVWRETLETRHSY